MDCKERSTTRSFHFATVCTSPVVGFIRPSWPICLIVALSGPGAFVLYPNNAATTPTTPKKPKQHPTITDPPSPSSQRWWDTVRMPEDVHVIDVVERLWHAETAPLTGQLQAKAV